MSGLATSGPTPSQLPGYGTHGIGTFSSLNGELLYLDSIPYQMHPSGKILPAPPSTPLPFVQVTKFVPEFQANVTNLPKKRLLDVFSKVKGRGGKNSFVPFLISGTFSSINLRIAGPQTSPSQPLSEVAANAKKWTLENVKGTMFGIASPEWMQGVSVAGIHAHFMTTDREEKEGGHVLDFEADEVEVLWAVTGRYHLGFPQDETWEDLNLSVDGEGLGKAEG